MEIAEVRQLIEAGIPNCEMIVDGEACNFSVVVVSDSFTGMSTVKRQQQVLATVKEPLATGALHAISMKVYTQAEWEVERIKLADSPTTP
jgi:acid stress-induced BolA-like protein IbaG/YrbA